MKKTLQYLFYAVFLILTTIITVMLVKSWHKLNDMKKQVSELELELHEKNTKCLELYQEIYDLKNNPHAVEKVAREKFKLAGENETIYTFEPKKKRKEK